LKYHIQGTPANALQLAIGDNYM